MMNSFKLESGDKIHDEKINSSEYEREMETYNYDILYSMGKYNDPKYNKGNLLTEDDKNDFKPNEENFQPEKESEVTTDNPCLDTNGNNIKVNKASWKSDGDSCEVKSDEVEADVIDRVQKFKTLIASLKMEIIEEKNKLQETSGQPDCLKSEGDHDASISTSYLDEQTYDTHFFSDQVDNKLYSDKKLIEYEKQLQKYKNTLNMAQNAKKSAIRKQMLAKALNLKLLEVENQCNIELLRIKQNLQCLEPLKKIAETWKTDKNELACDLDKYELLPLFPEVYTNFGSDISSINDSD